MSWLFSQALVAEYWEEFCADGAPCAQLNVMPTAQPFWRSDKPMDASRFSRFGLTWRLLTADRGEDLLTWFREDFLARTSPSPAEETDSMASAQVYGERWRASFSRWDHDTSTWRTHQCSLLGGLDEFSETWPNSGSMRNGECWERPTLELRTSESGSGFLPTPVTIDTGSRFNRSASQGAALRPTLGAMARYNLWPTPNVPNGGRSVAHATQVGHSFYHNGKKVQFGLEAAVKLSSTAQVGGSLNPTWVEWLMGWPIGWTDLQPLAMGRFLEWRQKHGGYSNEETNADTSTAEHTK